MSDDRSERFACVSCGKQYRWRPELAGKKVRCQCATVMTVPDAVEPELETLEPELEPMASADAGPKPCPECGATLKGAAVICVQCGTNLQTGQKLGTTVGKAVKTADQFTRSRRHGEGYIDGFFGRFRRSWQFAKISYGILWDFKQLLIFPILSGIAACLVLASFLLPLWGIGMLDMLESEAEATAVQNFMVYVILFAYYFCNFFVIAYFNTALTACAMKVCAGEAPTIGYGLSIATRRLPQIAGWALVSAVVGVLLNLIENLHEKIGAIVRALLGTAWTVLTFFVVPVLCVEGVGPIKAIKGSVSTLKQTWGEAVMGNFSMQLLTTLACLPIILLLGVMVVAAITTGIIPLMVLAVAVAALVIILLIAASSAADMVFRALLYNYATGRTIPEDVDEEIFLQAFASPLK